MANSDRPVFYWKWPYRVIPAVVTIPLALFFTTSVVGLAANTISETATNGWQAELIIGSAVGLSIIGLLSVALIAWSVAAVRAGRLQVTEGEIVLPKPLITPLAAFPQRVSLGQVLSVDFDEASVQQNKPPVIVFSIRMGKPIRLKLARYPQPDVVYDHLKQQLSDLPASDE